MELHPSSFVEYGGCSMQRIRSQPSRETGGVLLNECTDKYMSEFKLPYRNIKRYTQEVMQNMDKLSPQEKQEVMSSLQQVVAKHSPRPQPQPQPHYQQTMSNMNRKEGFGNVSPGVIDCVTGVTDSVSTTKSRTKELLNELYSPSNDTVSQISGTPEEVQNKVDEMRKGVREWSDEQCMAFHINWRMSLLIVLSIIMFFFLGLLIGRSN